MRGPRGLDRLRGLVHWHGRTAIRQGLGEGADRTCLFSSSGVDIAQPFWRAVSTAADKRVMGFNMHPTNYHQFRKVWLA